MPKNIDEDERERIAETLAQEALLQIEQKKYMGFLQKFSYLQNIYFVGIGFVTKQAAWVFNEKKLVSGRHEVEETSSINGTS